MENFATGYGVLSAARSAASGASSRAVRRVRVGFTVRFIICQGFVEQPAP